MKINDIILTEQIDQKEADMVYQSLIAAGDPYDKEVAKEFQSTRLDPRYTSIDAAQQAAETKARQKTKAKINKLKNAEAKNEIKVADPKDHSAEVKKQYSDKFYGNQYVDNPNRPPEFVNDLKKYMPVIDQGFIKGVESGIVGAINFTADVADTDLARLLPTPKVAYQSKLGRGSKLAASKEY